MSLNLKNEEETPVVNTTEIIETVTDTDIDENSNSAQESTAITSEEIVNIDPVPEPVNVENTYESRAAKRAERIAQFQADMIKKEKAIEDAELRLKLKLLSEEQKNAFLKEKAEQEQRQNLNKAKEIFREKREAIYREAQLEKQRQLATGLEYQQNLILTRAEKEEKARIQREAEEAAAESLRIAEEAKIAADIVNAEAERFAEEARRRLAFAESKAKENNKKKPKSINASDDEAI
jgi:hypothetical protein